MYLPVKFCTVIKDKANQLCCLVTISVSVSQPTDPLPLPLAGHQETGTG